MKYLLSLFAFIAIVSCSSQVKSPYSEIIYEAEPCFGTCPVYTMTVNSDRKAVIEAKHHTFEEGMKTDFSKEEGRFETTLSEVNYNALLTKLNNLNLKTLKDNYGSRNVTDLPTSNLRVSFADGTVKTIEDYGKRGTPALADLWKFIENLRKTEKWTKVK